MNCLKRSNWLKVDKWSRNNTKVRTTFGYVKRMVSSHNETKGAGPTNEKTARSTSPTKQKEPVKKTVLPLSLQYFSNDEIKKSECSSEKIDLSFKEFDQSLESIKFDIENLKALKIKHQELQKALIKNVAEPEYAAKSVLIGTADEKHPPSTIPCGGCGAFLHCNDPALPGYVPQELFKGKRAEDVGELYCKRCTLLLAGQSVQMDIDKTTYKQIIRKMKKELALILMVVDLTDISNSIIPEFFKNVGTRRPIFIVGNKIDLIPMDCRGYLNGVLHRLEYECEKASLNPTGRNIQHICLVSAKTGFGIEQLINKLMKYWDVRGDIYLVGTTNSGKSTLFNKFLESDYCKHTCRDIVQRATVSRWPGTTLNLIKFPIVKDNKWKLYLRTVRLKEDMLKDREKMEKKKIKLKEYGRNKNALLFGNVGRTDFRTDNTKIEEDSRFEPTGQHFPTYKFDSESNSVTLGERLDKDSVLELRRTILEEMYPESKWACDTPGLINNNQLINSLTGEELQKLLKVRVIHPRVFVLKPGDVMFITGLARIDYLEGGPKTFLTVHTNHLLPVHVVQDCNADNFYLENVGTEHLGLPLGDSQRVDKLPSLCGREFIIHTEDHLFASADLQLSSLGWVSFAAQDKTLLIRAFTPGGRGMYLREPALLPNFRVFKGKRLQGKKEYWMKKLKI